MKKEKILTIIFILILLALSSVTLSILIRNRYLVKEAFSEIICPPHTRRLSGKQSYNSLTNGYCGNVLTSGNENNYYYDDNVNQQSNQYCNFLKRQTLSGPESYNTETKAKCSV